MAQQLWSMSTQVFGVLFALGLTFMLEDSTKTMHEEDSLAPQGIAESHTCLGRM